MKKFDIRINDSHLRIYDTGEEFKSPIILLHGLTGNHFQLQFYRNFFRKDYRIIEVDFRGRGNSGPGEIYSSIVEHKKDIIKLIDDLQLKEVTIFGYSMGGYIASLVAKEINLNALVLLDSAAKVEDFQDKIVVPTFGRLSNRYESKEAYADAVVGNYKNMGVSDSEELREAVLYEVEEREDGFFNKSVERNIRSDWASMRDFDVENTFKDVGCPIMLIQAHGEIGSLGPLFREEDYKDTKRLIKKLKIYETRANHYTLVFNKQEKVMKEISDFLESRA